MGWWREQRQQTGWHEQKFSELHTTLDRMNNHIEDSAKRITETKSRISAEEDHSASLERRITEFERKGKTLTKQAEDSENRS